MPENDDGVREPTAIRDLIARNVTRLRRDAEASHSDVARAASHYGLDWTEKWIAGVERGQKALSAEHLLSLPLVLAVALKHRVALADLLTGDDDVALARDSVTVNASHIRDAVTASALHRGFGAHNAAPETPEMVAAARAARRAERLREIRRAGLGDVDIRVLAGTEAGAGEAEEKLARRYGVPQSVIVAASAMLWGRSMTDERDAHLAALGPGPSAAARARELAAINRRLSAQLAARLAASASRLAEAEARSVADAVDAATFEYPVYGNSSPGPVIFGTTRPAERFTPGGR